MYDYYYSLSVVVPVWRYCFTVMLGAEVGADENLGNQP
jgi:hypothetical protein